MIDKDKFFKLDLGEFPEGTETVSISLGVCSHFTTEYHYSWYRYSLIARHYLSNRSGLFSLDELHEVFKKEFDAHSKTSLLHKIAKCINRQDVPFLMGCKDSYQYKANSDAMLMKHFGEKFRGKIRIPVDVLKTVRGQYMTYIHICLGQEVDPKSIKSLTTNLSKFQIPKYKA